ncbi:MAG TPA: hypothetical protein VET88_00390 [Gammaproteobacteria bacterium]|nr:hypothetical protein [Gammaproteobacteria bacterium]
MDKEDDKKPGLWEWVKAICALLLVGVLSYKIYLTPIDLKVDFPTLLSLLLALFSVGLAALFYFKATETSNTFYDNTYNFTRDIAQLLVKIESGFGERLRHLDEGYSSMRDYMQQLPSQNGKEAKKRIEEEKEEIQKVAEERNQMIRHLVEKSQLHDNQKREFLEKLEEKEKELNEAQKEMNKMKRRMFLERVGRRKSSEIQSHENEGFNEFTKQRVILHVGPERFARPFRLVSRAFDRIKLELPSGYLEDMESRGFVDSDGDLTPEGASYLRMLAKEIE